MLIVISWLLQRSDNGATYLQIIVMLIIVFVILNILYKTIYEIIDNAKENDIYEPEKENGKKM